MSCHMLSIFLLELEILIVVIFALFTIDRFCSGSERFYNQYITYKPKVENE